MSAQWKVIGASALFVESLAGVFFPVLLRTGKSHYQWWLSLLNCFSGGVFLATGLVHLLPECQEAQQDLSPAWRHSTVYLVLIIVGYALVFFVERVLFVDAHDEGHTHCLHQHVFTNPFVMCYCRWHYPQAVDDNPLKVPLIRSVADRSGDEQTVSRSHGGPRGPRGAVHLHPESVIHRCDSDHQHHEYHHTVVDVYGGPQQHSQAGNCQHAVAPCGSCATAPGPAAAAVDAAPTANGDHKPQPADVRQQHQGAADGVLAGSCGGGLVDGAPPPPAAGRCYSGCPLESQGSLSCCVTGGDGDGGAAPVMGTCTTCHPSYSLKRGVILLVALSVHTLFESTALGLVQTQQDFLVLMAAIVSHKFISASALACRFLKDGATIRQLTLYAAPFALIAPLGILVGELVSQVNPWVKLTLTCLATGTFLYVAASEVLLEEFEGDVRCGRTDIGLRAARHLKFLMAMAGVGAITATSMLPEGGQGK